MSTYYHPQPTRPFTTPLTIPRPANYNYYAYHYNNPYNHTHRSNTPPSLSPSPAPSETSTTTTSSRVSIEIEELPLDPSSSTITTDTDTDSGIDTAPFEFEEAPENYRRAGRTLVYDEDDDEDDGEDMLAASHKSILYGFERLTARGRSGGGKRSYAESVGSVSSGGSWGDSGVESEGDSAGEEVEGGRRKVRRVHHRVPKAAATATATVGDGFGFGFGYGCGWDDNEIDMEL